MLWLSDFSFWQLVPRLVGQVLQWSCQCLLAGLLAPSSVANSPRIPLLTNLSIDQNLRPSTSLPTSVNASLNLMRICSGWALLSLSLQGGWRGSVGPWCLPWPRSWGPCWGELIDCPVAHPCRIFWSWTLSLVVSASIAHAFQFHFPKWHKSGLSWILALHSCMLGQCRTT